MTVVITLNDVEPAVRLNALLERDGVRTAVVSPLDDIRGVLKKERPDAIVFTGDLNEPATLALMRDQVWQGVASIGLTDVNEPANLERLRSAGFVEVYPKPVDVQEGDGRVERVLGRPRPQAEAGLIG